MPEDLAIVHLTDLHFRTKSPWALWTDPIIRAFQRLQRVERLQIFALAVTGDLVNSPDVPALEAVKFFLAQAADALGIKESNGQVDWSRIWIVDGNHDYRLKGLLKKTPSNGVEEGTQLRRMSVYRDPNQTFLVLGLDSSKQGRLARGMVELLDLRKAQDPSHAAYRYRIALVHHHLLPLPNRPVELDPAKLARVADDEAFKLLSNAGLTTDFLLEGAFHLVLHGHEHKPFAASVKYHDRQWAGHIMAVVGGPAAIDGFQLVTFRESGTVELTRYVFETADYRLGATFTLWLADDWKRADWERQRKTKGYYRVVKISSTLSETGDFRQESDISGITGGETSDINELPIRGVSSDPKSGRVALESLFDKLTASYVPTSDLPRSGPEFAYSFRLDPPAKRDQSHPGFKAVRSSGNNFALTREEMALRKPDGPFTESITFVHSYPTERLIFSHRFPRSYAPDNVEVHAKYRDSEQEDAAETKRASRRLVYYREEGFVSLDFDWTTPNHEYQVSWDLPKERDVYADYGRANVAQYYRTQLASLPAVRKEAGAHVLVGLRKRCFELIRHEANVALDVAATVFHPEEDHLGLWLFNETRGGVHAVVGTYGQSSGWWTAPLPWGAGVRGRAMKRGTVEFYRKALAAPHTDAYWPLDGCDPETYLLCVPIPLPPEAADELEERPEDPAPVKYCRLVVALASTRNASLLHHLSDVDLRHEVADLILFETIDLVKKVVPIQQVS